MTIWYNARYYPQVNHAERVRKSNSHGCTLLGSGQSQDLGLWNHKISQAIRWPDKI